MSVGERVGPLFRYTIDGRVRIRLHHSRYLAVALEQNESVTPWMRLEFWNP